jgi:hypothetical protein
VQVTNGAEFGCLKQWCAQHTTVRRRQLAWPDRPGYAVWRTKAAILTKVTPAATVAEGGEALPVAHIRCAGRTRYFERRALLRQWGMTLHTVGGRRRIEVSNWPTNPGENAWAWRDCRQY